MATYIGFSTVEAYKPPSKVLAKQGSAMITTNNRIGKKFRLTDEQVVIQDLINAFNIPIGHKVGNPGYGTTLWSFIYEPNTVDVQQKIETEVKRVCALDPRLIVNSVTSYFGETTIQISVEMAIAPFNIARTVYITFDPATNKALQTFK